MPQSGANQPYRKEMAIIIGSRANSMSAIEGQPKHLG